LSKARYKCPLCGNPVRSDEDFVRTLEYALVEGFTLHVFDGLDVGVEKRFHVEHFRSHVGDHFYKLVLPED
jgi:hypothetical protein